MKMVEFTRPMVPHNKGEQRAVPDEVATRLEAEGSAKIVPSVFDKQAAADEANKRKRYMTRGQR